MDRGSGVMAIWHEGMRCDGIGTIAPWSVPTNMCMLSEHLLDDRQPLLVELRLELALVPEALRLVSSKQLSS